MLNLVLILLHMNNGFISEKNVSCFNKILGFPEKLLQQINLFASTTTKSVSFPNQPFFLGIGLWIYEGHYHYGNMLHKENRNRLLFALQTTIMDLTFIKEEMHES